MVTTGDLRIRISSEHKELLKKRAESKNLKLSRYCRDKLLVDDFILTDILENTNKILLRLRK
jgi:uncharacterized protein (DUF1778 family)